MGGLVLTKGTRHLIKHFQKEFKGNRLDDLRNDPIDGTTTLIKDVFANSAVDLLWLTNNVKHRHSQRQNPADMKCLLPDDNSAGQAHLEARWIYFLTASNNNVLTPTNHQKIRHCISTVLNDNSYGSIDFDCIECDPQTVFFADEFDNNGAKYLRIVLGTPPMDKSPNDANLSLDPQGGYTGTAPILVPAGGNGGAAQGQNSNAKQNLDPKPKSYR